MVSGRLIHGRDLHYLLREQRADYIEERVGNVADMCRKLAVFCGFDLSYDAIGYILWNETGYPSFLHGDPVQTLSEQFVAYLLKQPHVSFGGSPVPFPLVAGLTSDD